jgi:hypothetical protein
MHHQFKDVSSESLVEIKDWNNIQFYSATKLEKHSSN